MKQLEFSFYDSEQEEEFLAHKKWAKELMDTPEISGKFTLKIRRRKNAKGTYNFFVDVATIGFTGNAWKLTDVVRRYCPTAQISSGGPYAMTMRLNGTDYSV